MSFKPLTIEDFNLSADEKKLLVEGAQKFFPPVDDSGEFIPVATDETKEPDHAR